MTTLMICGDTRTANRTLINRAVNQAETDQVIILTPSTTPGTLRSPTPDTGARRQIPIPPDPEATAAMLLETQPDAVALIYPRLQPPSPEALTVVSQAQELGIPVSAHYPKVVLVTGGPRFDNRATIAHVLDQEDPTRIVVAATGATSQAVQEYARNRGIPLDRPPEQEADDPDEDDLQQAPPHRGGHAPKVQPRPGGGLPGRPGRQEPASISISPGVPGEPGLRRLQ